MREFPSFSWKGTHRSCCRIFHSGRSRGKTPFCPESHRRADWQNGQRSRRRRSERQRTLQVSRRKAPRAEALCLWLRTFHRFAFANWDNAPSSLRLASLPAVAFSTPAEAGENPQVSQKLFIFSAWSLVIRPSIISSRSPSRKLSSL